MLTTEQKIKAAPSSSREMLNLIGEKFGSIPNMYTKAAVSSAVLSGYLAMAESLEEGVLPPEYREAIAIYCATLNVCDYCQRAHRFIASKQLQLTKETLDRFHSGDVEDPLLKAILDLVKTILDTGDVLIAKANIEKQGGSEELICEVVANVSINVFTNNLNKIFETEIDFPKV